MLVAAVDSGFRTFGALQQRHVWSVVEDSEIQHAPSNAVRRGGRKAFTRQDGSIVEGVGVLQGSVKTQASESDP